MRAGQPWRAPILPVERARSEAAGGPPGFEPGRAWAHLERQCGLGPRIPGTAPHATTLDWLIEQLSAAADEVALQRWRQRVFRGPGAGTRPAMANVLARVEGREPGPPSLMLCTHWDTRPVADQDPDPSRRGEPVPGANDGASGVAVLLEACRALAAHRPRRAVLIALFDGEDLGEYYYGSRLFARWIGRPEAARWRPEAAVVADMVGKRGLRCATEVHSVRRAPALWERVGETARRLGLSGHFGGPEMAINDDHVSLQRAGIPAVLLIDYAYPEWHTTLDTPDRCDPASLGVVGRVLVDLARDA